MKFLQFGLCIVLLQTGLFSCSPDPVTHSQKDFTQHWDTLLVLDNPHKGWYHHLLDNGVAKYPIENDSVFASFPGMDHLYLRFAWSFLEPQEGVFDWSRIDEVVEKYVPKGYGISFRITCKETGTYPGVVGQQKNGVQYATPIWVEEAGAKGIATEAWGVRSWTPVWNDPVYLAKLDNFHKAFAARYDHEPWVRYIDIGSIGEWGEGHTSFSTQIPPTVDEVIAHVDLHVKNYTQSLLVATDDLLYYGKPASQADLLFEYVTSRGITLRDDSPLVDWYLEQNLDTWSVSHPRFFDPLYLEKPIIFELQHYHMVKNDGNWLGKNGEEIIPKYGYSGAHIMRKAIETMGATWIGYHGYAEEWVADNPDLTRELANLCGYWYFPVRADISDQFKSGNNPVSITWINRGVAPAYDMFGLEFRLQADGQVNAITLSVENSGNQKWLPGEEYTENYNINIPKSAVKGQYSLTAKLVYNSPEGARDVHVGMSKESLDAENFFHIGNIQLK